MKIFKTNKGILIENESHYYLIKESWDQFINHDDLYQKVQKLIQNQAPEINVSDLKETIHAPIGSQEVWASGVTYLRSKHARMDESKDAGGGDFYDRVYDADRPELFFKSMPHKVVHPGSKVRIREDSKWNVPEPELVLMISRSGKIIGYTIGNDMSSRDIEGENPLYLPQAKCYDGATAIGPCIYVTETPLPATTQIQLQVFRNKKEVFSGTVAIDQIKRKFSELVHYLYKETSFPSGCLLMTGTGIVPPNDFTLEQNDEIHISIEHIGTLVNTVA